MPEKSIWEKISAKGPDTYTDGYGTKREVYEPTIIKWGRGAYQTLNKFFNGQDTVMLPDGSEGKVNKGIGALGLLTGAPSELSAIKQGAKYIPSLKKMSKPLSEAERLGIPKSMRSNPKALEDPQYWGYQQWNQRYNAAVESGNMEEAQRLRDLHFKIKTPDNKIVDYKGNPHKVYHGSPEDWYLFDDSKRGIDDVIYFSTDKAYADQYTIPRSQWQKGMIPTKSSRKFYLYGKEPINVGSDMYYGSVQDELIHNWANGLNADSVYGLDAITNPLNQSSGVEFGVLRRNQFK